MALQWIATAREVPGAPILVRGDAHLAEVQQFTGGYVPTVCGTVAMALAADTSCVRCPRCLAGGRD